MPFSRARRPMASLSMPRPSSLISSITDSPTVDAASLIVPSGRLPSAMRSLRRFDPVTDRIADEMEHRIHHPLDEELVDLGRLPRKIQLNTFAVVARQIAHDKRHPPEDLADGHQADAHHAFAQIAKVPLDALAVLLQDAPFRGRRETLDAQQRVLEPRTRDDQIADQAHQIVEAGEIDADEIRPADR